MRVAAIVTGITGQDGSYLAELLLEKDYDVFGIARRTLTQNTERVVIQGDPEYYRPYEVDVRGTCSSDDFVR